VQVRGDPVPGGPVADLVVVLQVTQEPVGGHSRKIHLPPVAACERRPAAVVEEHLVIVCASVPMEPKSQ
jgi:hypothetical protein